MLIDKKLSEPLSNSYRKSLVSIASCLRTHLVKCGAIKSNHVDMLSLKYNNNTSYNTMRRHVNVIVNYLIENGYNVKCFWVDKWISYGDPFEYEMIHYWSEYFEKSNVFSN